MQHERTGFLPGHHGYLSSHGMAVASNLSPDHHFLMFNYRWRDEAGDVHYDAYNRFPPGAFAAIRLVTLPFEGDFEAELLAARLLMSLAFIGALLLAFASVRRLVDDPWVAAAATLPSFSSFYLVYYADMIFNDVPALFGFLLVFHGLVVFEQTSRFRQLLAKTAVALLLGWQVLALLLAYVVAAGFRDARNASSIRDVFRGRPLTLGLFSLGCAITVLGANFFGEYLAVGGALHDLPSVREMRWRLGLRPSSFYRAPHEAVVAWPNFALQQLFRLGRVVTPAVLDTEASAGSVYAFAGDAVSLGLRGPSGEASKWALIGLGGTAIVGSGWAAFVGKHRVLLGSLAVSGLLWAIPMRRFVAFHNFQSIFYIGVPLVLFSIALERLARRVSGARIAAVAGATLLFVAPSVGGGLAKARHATGAQELVVDFQRIRDVVGRGRAVFADGGDDLSGRIAAHALHYHLSGNDLTRRLEDAELVVSGRRRPDSGLITPENRHVFLYRAEDWRDDPTE